MAALEVELPDRLRLTLLLVYTAITDGTVELEEELNVELLNGTTLDDVLLCCSALVKELLEGAAPATEELLDAAAPAAEELELDPGEIVSLMAATLFAFDATVNRTLFTLSFK